MWVPILLPTLFPLSYQTNHQSHSSNLIRLSFYFVQPSMLEEESPELIVSTVQPVYVQLAQTQIVRTVLERLGILNACFGRLNGFSYGRFWSTNRSWKPHAISPFSSTSTVWVCPPLVSILDTTSMAHSVFELDDEADLPNKPHMQPRVPFQITTLTADTLVALFSQRLSGFRKFMCFLGLTFQLTSMLSFRYWSVWISTVSLLGAL